MVLSVKNLLFLLTSFQQVIQGKHLEQILWGLEMHFSPFVSKYYLSKLGIYLPAFARETLQCSSTI